MNYNDYIFKLDHYDAWTYVIIGPLSLIAAFSFIFLNIFFKETRIFPGNLLIIISLAEMLLCIHWIMSGFKTEYISGETFDKDSNFCKINSHIAFVSATLELTFQFAFLISIIAQFKNTMKKIKFQNLFVILPLVFTIILWIIADQKGMLGKNIFGTCSVNQVESSGITFGLVTGSYLLIVLITIYTLRDYKKLSESRITIRDDFYIFYISYAILTFFMYSAAGLSFFIDKGILKQLQESQSEQDSIYYLRWFYLSRLTNNVKIFIPFFTFLLRIKDPFIQKLILKTYISRSIKEESITVQSIDSDNEIVEDDFIINNQIKQIRRGIARTIVKGIFDYYTDIIHEYKNFKDDEVTNLIQHEIDEISQQIQEQRKSNLDEEEQRNTDIDDERFFKCKMISMFSQKFLEIMKFGKLENFQSSFSVKKNKKSINNSGESDGGAGGEFFLCTHDKRFFIKTINSEEEQVFMNMIEDYTCHMKQVQNTMITRIIGYFVFDFKISQNSLKVIVMENVFKLNMNYIHRKYDIKGSKYKRRVLDGKNHVNDKDIIKSTLKDIDFINIEKQIELSPQNGMKIIKQLRTDVGFFQMNKIIDYSLLLGIIDLDNKLSEEDQIIIDDLINRGILIKDTKNQKAIIMGIIDFFQKYTWNKMFEKWIKKTQNFKMHLDTSSQPSGFYGKRFLNFMSEIFKYQLIYQIIYQFKLFLPSKCQLQTSSSYFYNKSQSQILFLSL